MSSFSSFAAKYRSLAETGYLVLHRLSILVENLACAVDEEATVQSRFKSASSTLSKMNLHGLAIDEVNDLLGIRVLVGRVNHCYKVLDAIANHWPEWRCEVHDYISRPKANGYQSIHVHVSGDHGLRFEIQIRTRSMHRLCEEGEAAHWRYKLTLDTDEQPAVSFEALEKPNHHSEHRNSSL